MNGLALTALIVLLSLGGCAWNMPYLLRAAYEEARILWRREPIARVLERDDIDIDTRGKLSLVLAVRSYAGDTLGFEVGNSYATVSRVEGDAVAHVVTAAYRDRLEPYRWRYPIVGSVPYRGFFDVKRAEAYAAELETKNLDTAVWPSAAFSTLGWFADPLPSNLLERDPVELAIVVFHELTHAQIYLPSAAEFNESLANFAGHRAAIDFFCGTETAETDPASSTTGPPADGGVAERCGLARARWRNERSYGVALEELAGALRTLYAEKLPPDLREKRRSEILSAASRTMANRKGSPEGEGVSYFTRFNNAVLLQHLLYRRELGVFEDAWRSQGRDLGRTIRRIADTARSAEDPFAAVAGLAR
jgi:predicted aminopeptidase